MIKISYRSLPQSMFDLVTDFTNKICDHNVLILKIMNFSF